MAPNKDPEAETNPYELLGIASEADDQQIRTAYRQRSLKVHPDRNRGNPDAARKFHELNQAYELLLDPLRRLALDAKLRLKEARAKRFANHDSKRKAMLEELEEKERQFKKAKTQSRADEQKDRLEREEIINRGRKMREDREREEREREEGLREQSAQKKDGDGEIEVPSLGELDTTLKLKYKMSARPTLSDSKALAALLSPFGAVDVESIVLSIKPPKKNPTAKANLATALVPFKQIGEAFAAVCASGRPERGLEGIEISWSQGQEPPILEWLRKMGKLGSNVNKQDASAATSGFGPKAELPQLQSRDSKSSGFSSFPESMPETTADTPVPLGGIDYESLTLMRMRQAERERLEREIRLQDEQAEQ